MDLIISLLTAANIMLAIALFVAKMEQRDRVHAKRVRERLEYKSYFQRDRRD